MAVRIEKPEFNLRDKLSQLDRRVGSTGGEILASKSPEDVQRLIGVGSRNMIINGGMMVAQRGTSNTPQGGSNTQYPCVDRWGGQFSSPSNTFTVSQSTDAPVGHAYSLKFLTNSAVSPSGVHYYHIGQNIEGNVFSATGWNASASGRTKTPQPCTLSFWVKSSNPGKWCVVLKGQGNHTHSYLIVYEIQKPDTWEWKTHTIYPSPEITNWTTGTSTAMRIQFDVGTSRVSDLGSNIIGEWRNHNTYTYNNSKFQTTRIHGISGATWYLTGVQFEPGPVATPFEHRTYGDVLMNCYRYYVKMFTNTSDYPFGYGYKYANGAFAMSVPLPTKLRATPSAAFSGLRIRGGNTSGSNQEDDVTSLGGMSYSNANFQSFTANSSTNNTSIGQTVVLTNSVSNNTSYIIFDSEAGY